MTSKDRIKAWIEVKPVERLPFWPKLDGAYQNKWGKPVGELHTYIGSDKIGGIMPGNK